MGRLMVAFLLVATLMPLLIWTAAAVDPDFSMMFSSLPFNKSYYTYISDASFDGFGDIKSSWQLYGKAQNFTTATENLVLVKGVKGEELSTGWAVSKGTLENGAAWKAEIKLEYVGKGDGDGFGFFIAEESSIAQVQNSKFQDYSLLKGVKIIVTPSGNDTCVSFALVLPSAQNGTVMNKCQNRISNYSLNSTTLAIEVRSTALLAFFRDFSNVYPLRWERWSLSELGGFLASNCYRRKIVLGAQNGAVATTVRVTSLHLFSVNLPEVVTNITTTTTTPMPCPTTTTAYTTKANTTTTLKSATTAATTTTKQSQTTTITSSSSSYSYELKSKMEVNKVIVPGAGGNGTNSTVLNPNDWPPEMNDPNSAMYKDVKDLFVQQVIALYKQAGFTITEDDISVTSIQPVVGTIAAIYSTLVDSGVPQNPDTLKSTVLNAMDEMKKAGAFDDVFGAGGVQQTIETVKQQSSDALKKSNSGSLSDTPHYALIIGCLIAMLEMLV